jgi:hypothetical protein
MQKLSAVENKWYDLKISVLSRDEDTEKLLEQLRLMLKFLQEVHEDFSDEMDRARVRRMIIEALRKFAELGGPPAEFPTLTHYLVDLFNHLMPTGPDVLGREAELRLLEGALLDDKINFVQIIGFGGMGKTALVNEWLCRVAKGGWRGIKRVCAFSFPGGTREAAGADAFIDAALSRFRESPRFNLPYDRGRRLGEVLSTQSILVLDSLESLQHPSGRQQGEVMDQAIRGLLETVSAQGSKGLCIITSRLELVMKGLTALDALWEPLEGSESKLRKGSGKDVVLGLGSLDKRSGADLLERLKVQGDRAELEAASEELSNVPLSLRLMGEFLSQKQRNIRFRFYVSPMEADRRGGNRIKEIMEQYQRVIDPTQWSVADCLGFFDRPASLKEFKKLWIDLRAPSSLDIELLEDTIAELQRYGILTPFSDSEGHDAIDAHPLVRQYFSGKLCENQAQWIQGHKLLFMSLCEGTEPKPKDRKGMAALAEAVRHGCEAKEYDAALSVYRDRMQQDNEYPVSKKELGCISEELTALVGFFELPWTRTAKYLDNKPATQAFLLHEVGYNLMAECRHAEAIDPLKAALELYEKTVDDAPAAAKLLDDLTYFYHTVGELTKALDSAERCVGFADQSEDPVQITTKRTTLAKACHYLGQSDKANRKRHQARRAEKVGGAVHFHMGFSLR